MRMNGRDPAYRYQYINNWLIDLQTTEYDCLNSWQVTHVARYWGSSSHRRVENWNVKYWKKILQSVWNHQASEQVPGGHNYLNFKEVLLRLFASFGWFRYSANRGDLLIWALATRFWIASRGSTSINPITGDVIDLYRCSGEIKPRYLQTHDHWGNDDDLDEGEQRHICQLLLPRHSAE